MSVGTRRLMQAPAIVAGGAAPVLESVTIAEGNPLTSITLTKPTGTASGDLLLCFIANDNDKGSSGEWSLSGWNEDYFLSDGIGRLANETILSKVAGGSEPSDYTFTAVVTGDAVTGIMLRISGQNATWLDTLTSNTGRVNDATPASINFTPSADDCLILQVCFSIGNNAVTDWSAISGYDSVNNSDESTGSSGTPSIGVCDVQQTTASATGANDWYPANTSGVVDTDCIALSIAAA